MKINRTCCNALIGTEQEQINQLYEFIKALAGNYFEGFEIMGTYSPTVNYNKKYMLVFFEGSTYIKTVDGDSVNFSPALNPDKWALFSSGTPADLSDLEKVIKGSETVVVDVNEAGTALEIHADYENIVGPLERALKKPVSNPTETVLAGVDAQGEQVLLPVSEVGGGVKWYLYEIMGSSENDLFKIKFLANARVENIPTNSIKETISIISQSTSCLIFVSGIFSSHEMTVYRIYSFIEADNIFGPTAAFIGSNSIQTSDPTLANPKVFPITYISDLCSNVISVNVNEIY